MRPVRLGAALATAVALCAVAAGCGGSGDVTLTIGARGGAEETILGEIYAQALKQAGFTVAKNVKLAGESEIEAEAATNALKQGRISGYPDHLSTISTTLLGWGLEQVPADPQTAYEEVKAELEEKGFTAFPPAPFSFTNAVGTLRKTAEARGLKKVTDLEGQSEELTIAGVAGCHESINCVEGLEHLYGLAFAGFIYRGGVETEPFRALTSGFSDLAMLPSTDGRLASERKTFATLEEDKHLFPAGNAIFVTTPEIADEAGPEFEEAIVAAQKGLTLPVMQELDAEVEIEKRDPAAVAAKYLQRNQGP